MLFYTLITTGFEHFLRSNQPNQPGWHVKNLVVLLVISYGEFCSFHRLVMPILDSQLNRGEFKLQSEL